MLEGPVPGTKRIRTSRFGLSEWIADERALLQAREHPLSAWVSNGNAVRHQRLLRRHAASGISRRSGRKITLPLVATYTTAAIASPSKTSRIGGLRRGRPSADMRGGGARG